MLRAFVYARRMKLTIYNRVHAYSNPPVRISGSYWAELCSADRASRRIVVWRNDILSYSWTRVQEDSRVKLLFEYNMRMTQAFQTHRQRRLWQAMYNIYIQYIVYIWCLSSHINILACDDHKTQVQTVRGGELIAELVYFRLPKTEREDEEQLVLTNLWISVKSEMEERNRWKALWRWLSPAMRVTCKRNHTAQAMWYLRHYLLQTGQPPSARATKILWTNFKKNLFVQKTSSDFQYKFLVLCMRLYGTHLSNSSMAEICQVSDSAQAVTVLLRCDSADAGDVIAF